ncbi:TetR/AcrR family transcriptional regulator [Gloeobacter morelensis]|uniref:TetR/AcrR family transcriptional regulator n=1 Tax=Gloeobacter morelensis MG652769 TaxID=2781736 RepID=A0ABY3PN62_9CYAN|nr:TetR/AcrR family transcriptional regulator [Gloeobacter morelensis]UFP95135.1 TetR/AcrR family transcriptional regulator [Gloeobacter morelensis MG652769]
MPKIVEHDQYRRALLRRCFDVFAEHGYAKTTMRQLAEALEVSTGTLYHYFPSKQAIFEQLMEQMAQEDSAALDAELAGMATIEAKLEAAMAFFERTEEYGRKQLLLFVEYYRGFSPGELAQDAALNRIIRQYEQLFFDGIGVRDPVLFHLLWSVVDGWLTHRIYLPHAVSLRDLAAILGPMVAGYLRTYSGDL